MFENNLLWKIALALELFLDLNFFAQHCEPIKKESIVVNEASPTRFGLCFNFKMHELKLGKLMCTYLYKTRE